MQKIFADHDPVVVVNLAAQAGVRYSITNPDAYIEANLIGFYNILKHAAIHMTAAGKAWRILSMRRLPRFTGRTKDSLFHRGQGGSPGLTLRGD
ncbi:MAG: GDP-mannose 4,6-dehydratase [Anaerovoracaceae bacterium]